MNSSSVFKTGEPGNSEWRIIFERIPSNLQELKELSISDLSTPFYTAALTVVSLYIYPENRDESIAMLNFLKGPQPLSNYEIQFFSDRFKGKNYLPASFFAGATPENGYKPKLPLEIVVIENPYSNTQLDEGYVQLFVRSSGADSPRPIKLRLKASTNQWFLWEQMLLSDIRQPASEDPWV